MTMKIRGIAHRGDPKKYPENTLSGFQSALEYGYRFVELDVQLSKDGVPIIMHDYTVDRMTDHKGKVKDFTLAELKRMKIGEQETIPTLEEAMLLMRGKTNVMVELKQAGHLYPGLEEKTLEVLRKTDTFEQALVISFDLFSLQKVRRLDPDVRISPTSSNSLPSIFPWLKEYRCEMIGVPMKMLTPEYADLIREHHLTMGPWPVDSVEEMNVIAQQYPDALITTNDLALWAQFYEEHPEVKRVVQGWHT